MKNTANDIVALTDLKVNRRAAWGNSVWKVWMVSHASPAGQGDSFFPEEESQDERARQTSFCVSLNIACGIWPRLPHGLAAKISSSARNWCCLWMARNLRLDSQFPLILQPHCQIIQIKEWLQTITPDSG